MELFFMAIALLGLVMLLTGNLEVKMESSEEQISRLEEKVDEILTQIKELKEQNENSGGQTH